MYCVSAEMKHSRTTTCHITRCESRTIREVSLNAFLIFYGMIYKCFSKFQGPQRQHRSQAIFHSLWGVSVPHWSCNVQVGQRLPLQAHFLLQRAVCPRVKSVDIHFQRLPFDDHAQIDAGHRDVLIVCYKCVPKPTSSPGNVIDENISRYPDGRKGTVCLLLLFSFSSILKPLVVLKSSNDSSMCLGTYRELEFRCKHQVKNNCYMYRSVLLESTYIFKTGKLV